MIILVEGPDNTGKTTLCKRLGEKYGYDYIHLDRMQDERELSERYISLIAELKEYKALHKNITIDRAYISNMIYSRIFKDAPILEESLYSEISSLVDRTIICLPINKEAYINKYDLECASRGDLYDNMSEIYDLYEKYLKEHSSTTIRYDWHEFMGEDIDSFIKEVIAC